MPVAVLGFVDFTSRAVNFGFELDTGSEQRERERRETIPSLDLLEDWDGIRLRGALQRDAPALPGLERSALVDRGELWLREPDRLWKKQARDQRGRRRSTIFFTILFARLTGTGKEKRDSSCFSSWRPT